MSKKSLKLLFELFFIFIIPIIFMYFSNGSLFVLNTNSTFWIFFTDLLNFFGVSVNQYALIFISYNLCWFLQFLLWHLLYEFVEFLLTFWRKNSD